MKKIFPILMLLTIAALMSVSCKSVPKALTDELNDSMRMTQAARQRAIDFEAPAYFPSDWEGLEAQYEAAKVSEKPKKAEVQDSIEKYNSLADSYNELFRITVPLYAQAREDEILSIRESIINTGFTEHFPEFLKDIDEIALKAQEEYEAENYYKARETALKALEEYETLQTGAYVYLARQEILDRNFNSYDSENFGRADNVAKDAIAEYKAGNKEAAIINAEEALLRYNLVLANGWTIYTAERHNSASKERDLAIAERANIASREIFREAETFFLLAQQEYTAENLHDAAGHYTDAEAMFAIARKDTEEKRSRAQGLLQTAEERIEESNEAALEAERIIEGGLR